MEKGVFPYKALGFKTIEEGILFRLAEVLLRSGAPLNVDNKLKCTPELLAKQRKSPCFKIFNDFNRLLSYFQLLRSAQEDNPKQVLVEIENMDQTTRAFLLSMEDDKGYTLLHVAIETVRPDFVKFLISIGADVLRENVEKQVPNAGTMAKGIRGKPSRGTKEDVEAIIAVIEVPDDRGQDGR